MKIAALLLCFVTAACSAATNQSPANTNPLFRNNLSYVGHWEFIRGRSDGRFQGESARSFHPRDSITLLFDGEGFKIYGIAGPEGGRGAVVMPGLRTDTINFHSGRRKIHTLLYESPHVPTGVHSASIVVMGADGDSRQGYVNIDEFAIVKGDKKG